ncbi:MAG: FHA domain-containing protein [Deltaproteobacteria bacterium]|nr:FHA domain-containing protein [Deltaproteobacteria bacterium]MBN2674016.1 FHA domain-containing protein [Deltaproteobacteria bacterium]
MARFRIIYQNSNIEAPAGRFDIGRSLDCHLVLDDPSVSRVHATLIKEKDQLYLEDRGSRNGCKLNGQPVSGRVLLKDGDTVGIGHQVIKITEIRELKRAALNTMGLSACPNCGNWISLEDEYCGHCGQPKGIAINRPSDTAQIDLPTDPSLVDTGVPVLHSGQMLAGLAQKALSKNKTEEAHKLVSRWMDTIVNPKEGERLVAEAELEKLANLLIDLAVATKEPERISELFAFFTRIQKLLPRKSVEHLYKLARGAGYRTSSELHKYIACLQEMSKQFSPGEKFIFRRIEGLVSVCN